MAVTQTLDAHLQQAVLDEQAAWLARLEIERWHTSTRDPAAAIRDLILRESPASPAQINGYRPRRNAA